MVQIKLPKFASKPGKVWPKPKDAKQLTEFHVYRWSPDDEEKSPFGYLLC